MLIKCPECELQVSDKALSCPHCGYPLVADLKRKVAPSKAHMKLPNGFGQITKLTNKPYRNPYRAMVTVGINKETGRPICKLLKPKAYFASYNEAYEALMEYNKNPYDLEDDITVEQLYNRWLPVYTEKLKSKSGVRTVTSSWKYCQRVVNYRVKDLRSRHIKEIMDEAPSANLKGRIKSLFNLMLDYAVEYEIVDRNVAREFNIDKSVMKEKESNKKEHLSFEDEEMAALWAHEGVQIIDWVLVQCYMGWRPQELGLIKLENVDLENMSMTGGMKTAAGTDRTIPIHSRIQPIVKRLYEGSKLRGSQYLLSLDDSPGIVTYDKYRHRFDKVKKDLGLSDDHRAHDPRKQFVTMAKKYNVDEYAIKRIVGHQITDLTEKVYTDRDFEWLRSEIEKIK